MDTSDANRNLWAQAYIRAQSRAELGDDNPDWWAVDKFFDAMHLDPEECWQGLLAVVRQNPPEEVLGLLGAGPLETLMDEHGPDFIDRVEREASSSTPFRTALENVWEPTDKIVWARIQQIL